MMSLLLSELPRLLSDAEQVEWGMTENGLEESVTFWLLQVIPAVYWHKVERYCSDHRG